MQEPTGCGRREENGGVSCIPGSELCLRGDEADKGCLLTRSPTRPMQCAALGGTRGPVNHGQKHSFCDHPYGEHLIMYITGESLSCSSETNVILSIFYISIKNVKKKKRPQLLMLGLAVWPWTSYVTFLSVTSLICRVR